MAIVSQQVFTFQVQGITDHRALQIMLMSDLPAAELMYIESETGKFTYWLSSQWGMDIHIFYYDWQDNWNKSLYISGLWYRDSPQLDLLNARAIAYDLFCVLERRGFQVQYLGGDIDWQE